MSTKGDLSPERRAALMAKPYMQNRDTLHHAANPEIDADEESLRLTRHLSPGAMRNMVLAPVIEKYMNGPFAFADYPLLYDVLDYNHSNLPRRGRSPWQSGGYESEELVDRTESRWLTAERVDGYGHLLASAPRGRAGQLEVVLHGEGAPRSTARGGRPASVVFPVMPNPLSDVPSCFESDGVGTMTEEREPDFAWPISRIVIRLMRMFAAQCMFCAVVEGRLRRKLPSYPDRALVVGRGQRIHVFPTCAHCVYEIERPYYNADGLDPRVLTFMVNDGHLAEIGDPEQKWY